MPTGRWNASALCVQSRPDAVLVVGGRDSSSEAPRRCAELLTHSAGASGGGDGAWRWRKLKKMNEGRIDRPGMLLLQAGGDRQRVLVTGGRGRTAEILQLSCSDPSDCGQWTLIAPLSEYFSFTFLAKFGNRIFAIGSFLVCIVPSFLKDLLLNLIWFLDEYGDVNELTSSAPGQLTVRVILRSRIPFSVLFCLTFLFISQLAPAESFAWRPLEGLRDTPI